MALHGLKVIEFSGLAPAPFCGMILSDFGAKVIRIDKTSNQQNLDRLARGKQSIAINLKSPKGVAVTKKLCTNADVVIEPYRKGVMEDLGLGPDSLFPLNKRLIYARLTGYGQQGPLSQKAGHDINYLAISGILSMLGRKEENPYAPINLLADFSGGGLLCTLGIVMALYERSFSGKGQVIDANMVAGTAYVGSWMWRSRDMPSVWGRPRGENMLDGGAAFYDTYATADGKFMSVGALEPQFYSELLKGLNLKPDEAGQWDSREQLQEKFKKTFQSESQEFWSNKFNSLDACCVPVLSMDEAPNHPHNKINNSFLENADGLAEPAPAPTLSRTPGVSTVQPQPQTGEHTIAIMTEEGFTHEEISELLRSKVVEQCSVKPKL